MKVINRAVMPNGTKIQLEDWRENNTEDFPNLHGFTIAAYPTAQRTGKWRWPQGGHTFRLTIAFNSYTNYSNDDVKADYEALKAGTKTLEDLASHFWNGEEDMWYLGMDVVDKGY